MNVYDSHRIADVAAHEGYQEAAEDRGRRSRRPQHLSHPRARAEKIYSELGKVRELKEQREIAGLATTIVVAGCVAQAEGAEIVRRQTAVDLVIGPQNYHRLPELLRAARRAPASSTPNSRSRTNSIICPPPAPATIRARGVSAFVTVQEGCDKFCTFCVVPYTRGAESLAARRQGRRGDRAPGRRRRARSDAARPERQCLSWPRRRRAPCDLSATCCARAAAIAGHRCALRYTTTHPNDMTRALIDAHRDNPGADALSASARAVGLGPHPRGHEPQAPRRRLSRTRRASPRRAAGHRAVLRFHRRLSRRDRRRISRRRSTLVREVGFASAFSFKYSPRPGTPAAEMAGPGRRARRKRSRLADIAAIARRAAQVVQSRDASAAACRCCSKGPAGTPARSSARRPISRPCRSSGPSALIGEIADVEIVATGSNSLFGRLGMTRLS